VAEQDVEIVCDQFAAVNERDFERAMNHYADDVVLVVAKGGPEPGTYEGKETVGRWFGNWFQAFAPDYRFDIDDARSLGDVIFLHARHGGRGRASGAEVWGELSYLYQVQNGKVARVEIYPTRDEALAAAGVTE
jgi:ketosteroid isomerase-like protein